MRKSLEMWCIEGPRGLGPRKTQTFYELTKARRYEDVKVAVED